MFDRPSTISKGFKLYQNLHPLNAWNAPPTQRLLSRKDVHIWRSFLDLPSRKVQELKGSLSIDERMKAEHFRFERDRIRFIAARGILRLILGWYLSVEPGTIRIRYEEDGKPCLQNLLGKTGIQFNLSHSEGLALYVFAWGHKVGIDIEYMHEISEVEEIVEKLYSARERIAFSTLPISGKQETFFNWWTRKEAYTKAVGEGLSYPLGRFDVILAQGNSAKPLGLLGDAEEGPRWSMWDVRPADNFVGAVVVEGECLNVQCWRCPN